MQDLFTFGRNTSHWLYQQYSNYKGSIADNPYGYPAGQFPWITQGDQVRQFKLTSDCEKSTRNTGGEPGEYTMPPCSGIAFDTYYSGTAGDDYYTPDPDNDATWEDFAKIPHKDVEDNDTGNVVLVNSLEIYLLEHDIVTAANIGGTWVIIDFMGPHVRHFQTPSGGIPAMSGGTFGEATCDVYQLAKDSTTGDVTYEALLDAEGNQISQVVYNQASESVAGSEKIQATRMTGLWVANYEECSSG